MIVVGKGIDDVVYLSDGRELRSNCVVRGNAQEVFESRGNAVFDGMFLDSMADPDVLNLDTGIVAIGCSRGITSEGKPYSFGNGDRVILQNYKNRDGKAVIRMSVVDGMGGQGKRGGNGEFADDHKAAEIFADVAVRANGISFDELVHEVCDEFNSASDQDLSSEAGVCWASIDIEGNDFLGANMGDVRIIFFSKNGTIKFSSVDDSYVHDVIYPETIDKSALTASALLNHRFRNMVSNALVKGGHGVLKKKYDSKIGRMIVSKMGKKTVIDIPKLEDGDTVVLVSDWATDLFTPEEIIAQIAGRSPEDAIKEMNARGNDRVLGLAKQYFPIRKPKADNRSAIIYVHGSGGIVAPKYKKPPIRWEEEGMPVTRFGGEFTGMLQNGELNFGTLTSPSGLQHVGYFHIGVWRDNDKSFRGILCNGHPCLGRIELRNGSFYGFCDKEGDFDFGQYKCGNLRAKGGWKNGNLINGTVVDKDGKYTGDFDSDFKLQDIGRMFGKGFEAGGTWQHGFLFEGSKIVDGDGEYEGFFDEELRPHGYCCFIPNDPQQGELQKTGYECIWNHGKFEDFGDEDDILEYTGEFEVLDEILEPVERKRGCRLPIFVMADVVIVTAVLTIGSYVFGRKVEVLSEPASDMDLDVYSVFSIEPVDGEDEVIEPNVPIAEPVSPLPVEEQRSRVMKVYLEISEPVEIANKSHLVDYPALKSGVAEAEAFLADENRTELMRAQDEEIESWLIQAKKLINEVELEIEKTK